MPRSATEGYFQFYRQHSAVSDPKGLANLYDSLPDAIEDIFQVLQNVLIHNWKSLASGNQVTGQRRADIEIRPVARLLQRIREIDDRPWTFERSAENRIVVDCRHFAILLCSILRQRGIAARTRHGFATYLEPGHNQSHVVCEYWNTGESRWVLADADTGQHDAARERFFTADAAWRGVLSGDLDASHFGYGPELRGAWCLRWEMVRDFAALNKHEMLTFDIWGINATYAYNDALRPEDAIRLNTLADLLGDMETNFAPLRTIYQTDARLHVPRIIRSQPYTTGIMTEIDLALEGSYQARVG